MEQPLVYLILGAPDSGRREIVADLIEGGLAETDRAAVLLPAGEPAHPLDARLPDVERWTWADGTIAANLPAGPTHIFFLVEGARNPVDQIEAFKAWFDTQQGELGRIICVVHSRLAARHPRLLAWFEACIHFSDVVLLNRRDGVENKWMSEFLNHFKKLHLPTIFESVRDGRVKNPALVLEPQARRLSHVFDDEQDWVFTNADGEELGDDEESGDDNEEISAVPAEDPYFARRSDGGRRVKELPDIASLLREDSPTAAPPSRT